MTTEVTQRNGRRYEVHRLDLWRRGRMAEGDVRREAIEARLSPELAHPSHVAFARVVADERRHASILDLERFSRL
jgi:hypothetical protein